MTLYERIEAIQGHLATEALTPAIARQSLVQLTALLGNVNTEQRHADHEYKLVLLGCMAGGEPANRARIRAEVTEQYQEARKWADTGKLVLTTIQSLKQYMRSLDSEMSMSR